MNYYLYKNFEKKPDSTPLNETLPTPYGKNRSLLPDETYVLVGYYKDLEQLEWILKEGLYNVRMEDRRGSLHINKEVASVRYLLLHHAKETLLLKLDQKGPRVFSRSKLIEKGYPGKSEAKEDQVNDKSNYLVFRIESNIEPELKEKKFNLSKLNSGASGHELTKPFPITMTELMRMVIRE